MQAHTALELDPQTRALLEALAKSGSVPTHKLSPLQARQAYLARRDTLQPQPPSVGKVSNITIDGPTGEIGLRLYYPAASGPGPSPALVYFHGGGFVIGDLDTHDGLCRELCNQANCVVIAVDYRLAPEHPYPAAALDCLAATRWVHANTATLQIDPKRIAVGGDSAGGQLAAVVALASREDPNVDLAFQLLIYPITDALMQSDSIDRNGEGYLLGKRDLAYYYDHYFQDLDVRREALASPLLADNLSGLPPAFVLTAGFDPLHDEGLAYANALSNAGTTCHYVCFARQVHGFILMGKVIDEANLAVSLCASALKRALKKESA
ncbi:MAG: alpha/beta hydrolase [Burkholderiaceae bacterium]|nr:alpha/beta hydrolase [Burkholderiaceae bacterium]MCD8517588.1 alpha/beta hydrolase [Burkholderiaceae bacterium]MCD8537381.1 alpha/beta hydrolase [Burkholderiaceae bacterium]MCD8565541.1 alpha/beta hydrolase [Burkholderiaceae bacterium]